MTIFFSAILQYWFFNELSFSTVGIFVSKALGLIICYHTIWCLRPFSRNTDEFLFHFFLLLVLQWLFIIFLNTSLLEYNCFTMLLVSVVQQSESAICIHISSYLLPLEPPSHLPYPTPLGGHKALS